MLIGRTGGTDSNPITNRDGMQQYVRDSLVGEQAVRQVYDRAGHGHRRQAGDEGTTAPSISSSARWPTTACRPRPRRPQIFLGMQVQCTQCHNHPFNDWKQNQFWELNAFFRQTASSADAGADTARSRTSVLVECRISRGEGDRRRRIRGRSLLRAAQRHDEGRLSGVRRRHRDQAAAATLTRCRSPRRAGQADRRVATIWPRRSSTACGPTSSATASPSRWTTWGRTIRPRIPSCSTELAGRFRAARLRPQGADPLDRAQRAVRPVEPVQPAQQARRSRAWARSRMFSHFYLRQMRPRSCMSRCSWPPRPRKPPGHAEKREEAKARVAAAVHRRLRHRRQRRNDDVQRHDSADA